MARVRLENVSKIYQDGRGPAAVDDVSLDVADGEFVVLVGPSGCGKSTTLRMIAGLESISAGRLLIGDRLVNDVPPADRDIAMVFQSYALYPHMSVRENLAFALTLRRLPKQEIARRVDEAARILELGPLLDRKPRQLSGGQRQRVAVGRAIVREPQVFLFDEPLSNLDAALRAQTRREIAKLHRDLRTTMIYVTHDQVEAMTLGDRIVVMHKGKVQQVDTPSALYEHPVNRFVAGFIGSPMMNFVLGAVDGSRRFRSDGGAIEFELPAEVGAIGEGSVELGVRPEDVHLADGADDRHLRVSGDLTVEYVEQMGSESHVHAVAPGVRIVLRVQARSAVVAGAVVRVAFDRQRIHAFDPATGNRVARVGS